MSGSRIASAPGYFVAAGPRDGRRRFDLARAQREHEAERDEERHRNIRQHEMRFANVQRHHRQETRGERRVARPPAHAREVEEIDGCRAEQGGDGAPPQVEVARSDLVERGPLTRGRAGDETRDRDEQLDVDVEAGIIEEVGVEVAGPHHPHGPVHQFRLVDAD
jgi:hypothetical protein